MLANSINDINLISISIDNHKQYLLVESFHTWFVDDMKSIEYHQTSSFVCWAANSQILDHPQMHQFSKHPNLNPI